MTNPTREGDEVPSQPKGVLLQVQELTVHSRTGESLLSDISFHVEPGELVALTGLSRSGKSVLLQSLAGLMKPKNGKILVDSLDLYLNLKAFRSTIGYVPAEFPLLHDLTVAETLEDEARLRLPRRTSSRERQERVLAVLQTVGLTRDTARRVGTLSNFEKRKLGIAVELMGSPGLLLVDASAEPLAPFEEVEILILLRELTRQGHTVIQVNERSRSVGIADKIIFLAPGGLLAWFGPGDETFAYLKGLLPRGVVKDLFGLQEALEVLVKPQSKDGIEWARRFREHEAYQRYVDDPINNRYPDLMLQTRPLLRMRLRSSSQEKLPPPIVPRASGLRKLLLHNRRNTRLLLRDRSILRLIALPLLMALATFILSFTNVLGPFANDPARPAAALGLVIVLVVLTAAFLVQNEISKEREVYQREQRTSPILVPYIVSKVWLVAILAIYQGLVWTSVLYFAGLRLTGDIASLGSYAVTFTLVAFIGGILGLVVSAVSKPVMTPLGWVLLLTVPQLLLLLAPVGQWPVLGILSLGLIVALLVIQRGAGTVKV